MSERKHKLPYFFDTGALALGEYAVLDIDYQVVQVFGTEEEAEAFIAKANGTDVATVRGETTERARKLAEYRENMIRGSREKATRRRAEKTDLTTDSQQGAQS